MNIKNNKYIFQFLQIFKGDKEANSTDRDFVLSTQRSARKKWLICRRHNYFNHNSSNILIEILTAKHEHKYSFQTDINNTGFPFFTVKRLQLVSLLCILLIYSYVLHIFKNYIFIIYVWILNSDSSTYLSIYVYIYTYVAKILLKTGLEIFDKSSMTNYWIQFLY